MSNPQLPNLTVLLSVLADHPNGLKPDQILAAMADRGTTISRPTLNRLLVQARDQGKLVAEGITTGRTYRLADEGAGDEQVGADTVAMADIEPTQDIVSAYGSKVWATADVLRGVGVKQSEWPGHMMPFFAVMLLESRVLRIRHQAMVDMFQGGAGFDRTNPNHLSDLKDYYIANTPGTNNTWHEGLLLHGEGMRTLAKGGPAGMVARLNAYLAGYDAQTQQLIGYGNTGGEKYLGIQDTIKMLSAKGSEHLSQWVIQWSHVDLAAYDSAAITTLEEHTKKRWSDISADTAGEQFTPFDLFHLVSALADDHFKRHPYPEKTLAVYDPTCGGGNMLFGVADRLRKTASEQGRKLQVKTCGQEINDTLYALAAVEARFRENADIRHGNTLTADQFVGEKFGLIVANPPYGVDWKSIVKDIESDATGRFPDGCRPPTSDGQHLFLQHIQAHLADHGLAFVFCSGTTLFSGGAGGGESNARMKYFQTDDDVMGIIQLPKDEFFNTGINTYLWIFKNNKPGALKGRAFFLDASNMASKLKKSLGSKRNELGEDAQAKVVALVREAESQAEVLLSSDRRDDGRREQTLGLALEGGMPVIVDTAEQAVALRLLDVDEVCYNRVDIEITRGNPAFRDSVKFKQAVVRVYQQGKDLDISSKPYTHVGLTLESETLLDEAIGQVAEYELAVGLIDDLDDRIQSMQADPKNLVAAVKDILLNNPIMVEDPNKGKDQTSYFWNIPGSPQERSLSARTYGLIKDMGRAALSVAVKIKKGRKDDDEKLVLGLEFGPDIEKDIETTPMSSDVSQDQVFRKAFLGRWVSDAHEVRAITPGCEVNFNRLFPATGERKTLDEVNRALEDIDAKIAALHGEGA